MGRENGLQRYLRIYLAKLKRTAQAEPREENSALTMTASWLLSGCKHPRTSSFAAERSPPPDKDGGEGGERGTSATLADVDRFLFDNFNSLYNCRVEDNDDAGTSNALTEIVRASAWSSSSSSVAASGSSYAATAKPSDAHPPPLYEHSVAVMTYSQDPYTDFRRSLQDMVEARHEDGKNTLDWDFMEELLISYLELNERTVHKHILRAFTDIAVSIRRRLARGGETAEEVEAEAEAEAAPRRRRRKAPGRARTSLYSTQHTDTNPA